MPKWLRYLIAFACIAVGLIPLVVAPGLAESNGWDRATGSNIGALISVVWFVVGGWISLKIIRRRERHRLHREFGGLLAADNEDGNHRDQA